MDNNNNNNNNNKYKLLLLLFYRSCLFNWDPFQENKERSFSNSIKDIQVVGTQLLEWINKDKKMAAERSMFDNFLLVSLSKTTLINYWLTDHVSIIIIL